MLAKIIGVVVFIMTSTGVNVYMQNKAYQKITSELIAEREHHKMLEEERAKDSDRTKQNKKEL
jgi:hypothetical protein